MNAKVKNMSLIVAIAASVYSLNASAGDSKVYNGSMCQPLHGSQAEKFYTSATAGISNEPFNNSNTQGRWVSCPIVRDIINNTNGVKVWVNVDRNDRTSLSLNCTVTSSNTTSTGSVDSLTKSQTQTGRRWLNFDLNTSQSYGTFSLSCYLPAKSTVKSYVVSEK